MEKTTVRVHSAESIAQDIKLLRLVAADGGKLPCFEPGAHIDLHLAPGLVRQYSLCGPEDSGAYEVAVKLEASSRGGSKAVHERLTKGTQLEISVPRNNFRLAAEARHSLLFAGGIGITPLISMARALARRGEEFELLYFCRSEAHAAFREELGSAPLASRTRLLSGLEREQVIDEIDQTLLHANAATDVYMCGPKAFMDGVKEAAARRGIMEDRIHLEHFAADLPPSQVAERGRSFHVRLARSGVEVDVPQGQSLIDVLRANGIDIETSCEQGVCGTCVTGVLEGQPEHHDSFLTAAEKQRGDCMAICVSRAQSPSLVLDL